MLGFGLSLLNFILLIYFGSEISMNPLLGDLSIPLKYGVLVTYECICVMFQMLLKLYCSYLDQGKLS
jgi:hypothetical protein